MQNGLYVAASGLLMQQQRVDVISNNIANVNTAGFKRELALFSDYRPVDPRIPQDRIQKTLYNRTINSAVKLDDIATDFQIGHFMPTGNEYDLALKDTNSFFALETPWGVRYTRDGEFTLNSDSELVNRNGFNLFDADTGAPIAIAPNAVTVSIMTNGAVNVDGIVVGNLAIASFTEMEKMQKVGYNMYTAVGALPQVPATPGVMQGYVEASNVDPIREMVSMIESMRAFEMYQKVATTYDELNNRAANNISGRQ